MPNVSFGKFAVEAVASLGPRGGSPERDTPFRIAVLGDFSGRGGRGQFQAEALHRRPAVAVDQDNFEQVLAGLDAQIPLPLTAAGGAEVALPVRSLDDFHPDRIFEQLEVFGQLRQLRRRLNNPRTFPAAAAEVRGWKESAGGGEAVPPPPRREPSAAEAHGLLEQLLGGETAPTRPPPGSPWEAMIAEIVAPHVSPKPDPDQPELVASVDAAATELMRTILHHPGFQAVETAWRSVAFLVSRLELDPRLTLHVLDVTQAELAADVESSEDLAATGFFRSMVEPSVGTLGGKPWTLWLGLYRFGPVAQDARVLGRLARLARQAGAAFLTGADPAVVGCRSIAATPDPREWSKEIAADDLRAWDAMRRLPEASSLGLLLPRFLLRIPYGRRTSGTEQFAFEEMPVPPRHEAYLWGHPAVACGYVLARAFRQSGWRFGAEVDQDVDDLPVHVYRDDGEPVMQPCGEAWLSERAVEAIAAEGLMPLVSFRDRGAVRLGRVQSLADPPARLHGRWT